LIEGKKVRINPSAFGEQGTTPIVVDTSRVLFCFGGAFNGLEKIVGKKLGLSESKIGFKTSYDVDDYEEQIKNYEIYNNTPHDILAESLIEFGMATEFVGRIQTVVPLVPLNKEQMLKCLLDLETSSLTKNIILFAESNLRLEFEDEFCDAVVEKAIKSGTGTRALNSIVKTAVSQAAFDHLGKLNNTQTHIIINKDCVNNPRHYVVG
jgi:ATP-dependent Clp protease ATP-binding subunit ClpX